jgi:hypothetical protein
MSRGLMGGSRRLRPTYSLASSVRFDALVGYSLRPLTIDRRSANHSDSENSTEFAKDWSMVREIRESCRINAATRRAPEAFRP